MTTAGSTEATTPYVANWSDILVGAHGFSNARFNIGEASTIELAKDIAHSGLINPLVVWEVPVGDPEEGRFEWVLIGGHRRHAAITLLREEWLAANPDATEEERQKNCPFNTVNVVSFKGSLGSAQALSLKDNLVRQALSDAEGVFATAATHERLSKEASEKGLAWSQAATGASIGKSQGWVAQQLAITKLPTEILDFFREHNDQLVYTNLRDAAFNFKREDGTHDVEAIKEFLLNVIEHGTKKAKEAVEEKKDKKERTTPTHKDLVMSLRDCEGLRGSEDSDTSYLDGVAAGILYAMGGVTKDAMLKGERENVAKKLDSLLKEEPPKVKEEKKDAKAPKAKAPKAKEKPAEKPATSKARVVVD